jgi:hypothetical protein
MSFERKADAKRHVAKVTTDLVTGTYVDPRAGKITLRKYAGDWLAAQSFDPSTRQATELRLRLHVHPYLGDKELRAAAERGAGVGPRATGAARREQRPGGVGEPERGAVGRGGRRADRPQPVPARLGRPTTPGPASRAALADRASRRGGR